MKNYIIGALLVAGGGFLISFYEKDIGVALAGICIFCAGAITLYSEKY